MSRPSAGGATSIAVAAGSIAVITAIARLVGFARWFAFSGSVGSTCVGTVYQSVNVVPNVLYEVAAGGVLAAVVVPLVAGQLARSDRRAADETASALLTWVLVILVPLAVVVAVFARPIAQAMLHTPCAAEAEFGAELLRVFAVQIPLYGVGIVLGGVLQSHRRFVAAALAPLLSSVVVIATYLVYAALVPEPEAAIPRVPSTARLVLGVGTTLGVVALSLPLLVPVLRSGTRLRPRLRLPEGVAPRLRVLALAGALAVTGQQLATVIIVRLANDRGGAGAVNVFTYAQAVMLLPYAVLAVPVATAAFPGLAGDRERAIADEHAPDDAQAAVLRRAWFAAVAAGLLGTGLVVAAAVPVGRFFEALDAGRGSAAGAESLAAMDDTLVAFAPSVLSLAVIALLGRACYVRGNAAAAGLAAGLGWLATTVLPLLVLEPSTDDAPATLHALGLGTSAGLAAGALGLVVLAVRGWGGMALRLPTRAVLGILAGSAAGATVARVLGRRLHELSVVGWAGASVLLVLVATVVAGGVALAVEPSLRDRSTW